MSGVNGEQAAMEWAAECTQDEADRCAKFLARIILKEELHDE
jgi:hypothetical protein